MPRNFRNGTLVVPTADLVHVINNEGRPEPAMNKKMGSWQRRFTSWESAATLPLFIKEEMGISDVSQGNIRDCWFIAAVAAIINCPGGSQIIQNLMIDDGHGNVTVRLYTVDSDGRATPRYIKVVKSRTSYMGRKKNSSGSSTGVTTTGFWPLALEKAACFINRSTNSVDTQSPGIHHLDGGEGVTAFQMIFGVAMTSATMSPLTGYTVPKPPGTTTLNAGPIGTGEYTPRQDEFFATLENYRRENRPVAFTTVAIGAGEGKSAGMVGGHCYAIVGTETLMGPGGRNVKYIKVANPWGDRSGAFGRAYRAAYVKNDKGAMVMGLRAEASTEGVFLLELTDFSNCVGEFSISRHPIPRPI
jgi:hypothetical protein